MVVATKQNGKGTITKKFTKTSWDLLGKPDKNGLKNGWREVEDTQVINTTNSTTTPPATGNKQEIKVETETKKDSTLEVTDTTAKAAEIKILSKEDKEEFIKTVLNDVSADTIKNYFDALEIPYTTKDKEPALKLKLAEHLEYSEEKFKENF